MASDLSAGRQIICVDVLHLDADDPAEGEEPMTAGGGNLIGSEVSRNERSVQWTVATIEAAGSG